MNDDERRDERDAPLTRYLCSGVVESRDSKRRRRVAFGLRELVWLTVRQVKSVALERKPNEARGCSEVQLIVNLGNGSRPRQIRVYLANEQWGSAKLEGSPAKIPNDRGLGHRPAASHQFSRTNEALDAHLFLALDKVLISARSRSNFVAFTLSFFSNWIEDSKACAVVRHRQFADLPLIHPSNKVVFLGCDRIEDSGHTTFHSDPFFSHPTHVIFPRANVFKFRVIE